MKKGNSISGIYEDEKTFASQGLIFPYFQEKSSPLAMKIILFATLFLIPLFTFAQDEKEVVAAVEKMRTALLAEDVATLKSLSSEDLTYGHSSGVIENQEQFLEVFASKKTD